MMEKKIASKDQSNHPLERKYSKTHPKASSIEKEITVYDVAYQCRSQQCLISSFISEPNGYREQLVTFSMEGKTEGRKEGRKQDKARGSIIGQFRVHYRY